MSNEQDVIASVVEDQNNGQVDQQEVGQDEGTIQQEDSTEDWESQAKYYQSEKDKLHVENQQLKQYEKVGKFLESRPDLVKNLMSEVGQPDTQPRITLKPDEFDPWEAYNDPSSASYKFRMQELQETINGAVDQAVGGLKAQQGRTSLRTDLSNKGLSEQEQNSFFEFADKHPSEYGLDNVLKMWRAVAQSPASKVENPLDQIRENQTNPQAAGVLQGSQPEKKSETDMVWDSVMNAGKRSNVLK